MTKKRQPPLLDPSGTDLPSPLFTPRPGWGGQLKAWSQKNAYATIFRVVLLVAILLVSTSIIKHREPQVALPTASPEPTDDAYVQTAARGEGLNRLAGRALDAYLAEVEPPQALDAIEHIWAVDRLVNIIISMSSVYTPQDIEPGQTVRFPTTAIEYAIKAAKDLSPAQRAALSKYVK